MRVWGEGEGVGVGCEGVCGVWVGEGVCGCVWVCKARRGVKEWYNKDEEYTRGKGERERGRKGEVWRAREGRDRQ